MTYNPEIHHRRTTRIKEYDYSKEGMYFITICTKDRKCILSKIEPNTKKEKITVGTRGTVPRTNN